MEHILRIPRIIVALLLTLPVAAYAVDCKRDGTPAETSQCTANERTEADHEVNRLYSELMHQPPESTQHKRHLDQLAWEKQAERKCKSGKKSPLQQDECLTHESKLRAAALKKSLMKDDQP